VESGSANQQQECQTQFWQMKLKFTFTPFTPVTSLTHFIHCEK